MTGENSGLPLLNLGLGGFVFSFVGALLAIGIGRLFAFDGEYWVLFSAIGATIVSTWGWLYWRDGMPNSGSDVDGKKLKEGRFS